MANYRVISSDSHIYEPADMWTSRAESKFKDRMPHIESDQDGDWWFCDGYKFSGTADASQAGVRFEDQSKLTQGRRVEEIRPGAWIPEEHVKDMDIDGVDAGIIYPSAGLDVYNSVPDTDLLSEIFRIYNNWLAEFCKPYPDRLKGIAMINIDEVKPGVKELERCAKMGLAGGMISVYPLPGMEYDSPEYDILWAAAQDLQMPLALHVGTNRPRTNEITPSTANQAKPSVITNTDHWARMSLANIIFGGVFQRFPKLQIGAVEHELSWAPHFLDRMDYTYTQRVPVVEWWSRYTGDKLPSEHFRSNVFIGFQEDGLGIKMRDIIGVDTLMWGSDYPHTESTFPRSRQILEEILADCSEEDRAKIAGGNVARVYNLN